MLISEMKTFLGKKVKVTLSQDESLAAIVTGTLLGFGDGGVFEILEEDGFVHYCWPLLDMEELDEEN